MKKNMLAIIILVLCVANITLTSILMFAMLPSFSKTNRLITKVSKIVDLEAEVVESEEGQQYDVGDLAEVELLYDAKQTLNLKKGTDGEDRYVLFDSVTLSLNSKAKDYKTASKLITDKNIYAKTEVANVLQSHTKDELDTMTVKAVCDEAAARINEVYNTECVVGVVLVGYMTN